MGVPVRRAAAVAVLIGALCLDAGAEGPAPAPQVCPAIDAPAGAAPAIRIFVDPATGRRRAPTAEELRRFAEARQAKRRAAISALVLETHAGGMKSVDLGEAFLMEVVMAKEPDGSQTVVCRPAEPSP